MTERLPAPDVSRFPDLQPEHVRVLRTGHQLGRIYAAGGRHPTTWWTMRSFGPTQARFDHHPPPPRRHSTRRVMYVVPNSVGFSTTAHSVLRTCLAEVYRDRGVIELRRDDPYFALFDIGTDLTLLDVADGPWITVAGGNAAISSGVRGTARAWSRAIHRTYPQVDGVVYTCSNMPATRCVALWERAEPAIPVSPGVNRPLTDAALRADIETDAEFLGLDLVA